ncbi:MAG TPA: hypothetical protein VFD59_17995 [Nocardioidaceae bacterium]|nr:hypothetical protein [Nocardioidaceae bacterium]
MMGKLMLLGAGAAGYVLGAKAGRERYEQISRQAQKIRGNPTVAQKVDEAKDVAREAASTATDKVRSQAEGAHSSPGSDVGRGDESR